MTWILLQTNRNTLLDRNNKDRKAVPQTRDTFYQGVKGFEFIIYDLVKLFNI